MRRRFRELEKCETFTDRTVNGRAASPDQRCAEDIMVVSAIWGSSIIGEGLDSRSLIRL